MEESFGSNGVEVERFVGGLNFFVKFLLERCVLGWLLGEDVAPFCGDGVEDVKWVCDGLAVVVDSPESCGVFVLKICETFVFVLLEVFLPVVDAVMFLLLVEVLLYGEECVDDSLALC